MKKFSPKVNKIIAGTLSASTLTFSCSESNMNDESIYSEINHVDGENAIPINFDTEEVNYLRFLDKLGKDIIKYPFIAKEFSKNPQLFLKKYGYEKDIDLEEGILKLILSLGDEDILLSVKNNDFEKYFSLLKEKNILNDDLYFNVNISDKEKKEILLSIGFSNDDIEATSCTVAGICVAYVLVAVVSSVGVGVSAAVGLNLAAVATLAVYAEAYLWGPNSSSHTDQTLFMENNPSFKIWTLKGGYKSSFIATDMYIEKQVHNITTGIEKSFPNAFEQISKENVEQLIKLNLLKSKL